MLDIDMVYRGTIVGYRQSVALLLHVPDTELLFFAKGL